MVWLINDTSSSISKMARCINYLQKVFIGKHIVIVSKLHIWLENDIQWYQLLLWGMDTVTEAQPIGDLISNAIAPEQLNGITTKCAGLRTQILHYLRIGGGFAIYGRLSPIICPRNWTVLVMLKWVFYRTGSWLLTIIHHKSIQSITTHYQYLKQH